MKSSVVHPTYGELLYEENFWTGKKKIYLNGYEASPVSKNFFRSTEGYAITIKGNFISGVKVTIANETVQLIPAIKWYDVVLAILPALLCIVWGNVTALWNIFPIANGAIGGVVSGMFTGMALLAVKRARFVFKILIAIALTAISFFICHLIVLLILSIL